ncbi:hypothetical protein [Streptosporangium sp. KLBMP 9127]|nr:hypothetical protein [Streptosporangium sp. KLBMP 9127]
MHATIGVLLPVRIETRFSPGLVRLRVVPDEPWFARHDPKVSDGELEALRLYADTLGQATTPAAAEQAWRDLAGHVGGGARALYLVRRMATPGPGGTITVREAAPEEIRTEPAFPRVEGFPEQLHVWLARGGGPPVEVLTLTVDRTRLLTDFPDPDAPGDRRWWENWDEAVAAGLAGKFALSGNPADIDVLYVTGLGDGDPARLFADHRDAGRLGLLAPGEPTNSVDGRPAASFGQDPMPWRDLLESPPTEVQRQVSAALTGDPSRLGPLPGTAEPHRDPSTAMVAGLWPALWGFAGQDVWGVTGDGTADAAAWAPAALLPEGPFPTLRVGSQPYGLLPVTVLDRWTADAGDPAVEDALAQPLLRLRAEYAAAARARGTVVGASTAQLLELIGQLPASPLFRHRHAWPLELWWLVLTLLGYGLTWDDLDRAWHDRHPLSRDLKLDPVRRYGTAGAPRPLRIPLVVPEKLPEGMRLGEVLKRLVEIAYEVPWIYQSIDTLEKELLRFPPDSLLLRLAIRSLQVAIGDVGRVIVGDPPPAPEPVAWDASTPGRLQSWISAVSVAALTAPTPEARRFAAVADGLLGLTSLDEARVERLLRAVVDTAAFRVDPWLTGLPTRRLDTLLSDGDTRSRLGVYGWVDGPRPGTPGPNSAGMIHAPSPAQALAATVLRDRAVNDGSARWDLELTSRGVRDADRIAEHVRVGAHLAEALGREVERVVFAPADVARLRHDFPVRTEHAGRRVCDGLAVLAAPPSSLSLDPDRLAGLARLRTAVDAYGDLLVAEAVQHVTHGRAEVAGAVMDAAAGLSRPPHLEILRTPRQGRAVTTCVVVALPGVTAPVPPADPLDRACLSPGLLADPSVALFLEQQLGTAGGWTFTVAEGSGATATVTLADLGLLPVDAPALSLTDLERLAVEAGAANLGVEAADAVLAGGTGPARYEAAARLTALLGRRPAGPDAFTEQADAVVDVTTVDADLLARYIVVADTLTALGAALVTELGAAVPDLAVLTRLGRAARAWGVAPDPPPGATGPDAQVIAVAERAADLLTARLAAAPGTASPGPGEPSPAAALARDDLVAALAALASPTGQLAVTSRLPRTALPALTADPGIGDEWLPTVAAVRESVARIEAHQLVAETPRSCGPALTAWTNKPGDPWQVTAEDGRRLILAFAGSGLALNAPPGGPDVAAAVIDRFTEVIPDTEQTTAVTFGFDAPGARAQQAILLAVPPDPAVEFDPDLLVELVAGARELAHARVARPADLSPGLRGMLPTALLPATGATTVPLEPRK